MDYAIYGILQARILEWISFSLLQGILPTQGSNPVLLHCRQILYQLSHKGSTISVQSAKSRLWGTQVRQLSSVDKLYEKE